ncbi:hypothetical protein E1A91_D10G259100v1 [Gossypium mustelinum]|uniref:Uncharacterized protein n=1 Tax=Gossypium mustelinum TaxID=34275 RepID=A0A5D2TBQ3_GOSMU|nr:hypothetical protein E1A91_D10G259100v1 [Gossypium mustelinum]
MYNLWSDRIHVFPENIVHVAASAGHIEFMMEMIKLKPTFARKPNQAGFSPMHLALQNDRTQAVLRLLRFDEGLVRVKGREDLTPLHHVVQTGNVDLLVKLLAVCPEAMEDVTVRDETIFHLAVKNDMFEAFQVLVGWLIRSRHETAQRWEKELLSWADIDGNTVLHIAAIRNRPRVMEVLLEHLHPYQINAKNLEGLTAVDIQSQYPWNERQADRTIDTLSKAGGLSGSSSSLPNTSTSSFHIDSLKKKMTWYEKWIKAGRRMKGMPHEMRNTFLIVTVLIITTTYDASLNPPNTPDDSPFKNYQFSLSQDQPLNSYTFLHKTDINTAPMPSPSAIDVFIKDEWSSEYSSFWVYNSLTFWAAVLLTAILLPPHSFSWLILLALTVFGRSYMHLAAVSSWSRVPLPHASEKAYSYFSSGSVYNQAFLTFPVLMVFRAIFYAPQTLPNQNSPCYYYLVKFSGIVETILGKY